MLGALVCLSFCGCSENENSQGIGIVTPYESKEDEIYFKNTSLSYSFPEFLNDGESISRFSRLVYQSFDYEKNNAALNENPVDGFYCDMSFCNGKIFRYSYNGLYGLVDVEGNILLNSTCSSITQIRPDLFQLEINGGYAYASVDSSLAVNFVGDESFDWVFEKNMLEISQASNESSDMSIDVTESVKFVLKTPDGKVVCDQSFDSIAEASKENYDIECESLYVAYSDGASYILVFDRYYNYSMYEGSYGTVDVSLKGKSGSCYILSYDHYVKLSGLMSSFEYSTERESDEGNDYVSITFDGASIPNKKVIFYSNGFCSIASADSETGEIVTTYYNVPDEAFSDVVKWIDVELSTEYSQTD